MRVPQADGTLVALPVGADDASMPSLLTLTDVMCTGHHAALTAGVAPGKTVAVVGDGAVGLCGVIAAKRLGAAQIILLGRHPDRIALANEFGATDIVSERGEAAVERVRARATSASIPSSSASASTRRSRLPSRSPGRAARSAASASPKTRVAQPASPSGRTLASPAVRPQRVRTSRNCSRTSSKGTIDPGRVFDQRTDLDGVPNGYRAMNKRETIKVMIEFS